MVINSTMERLMNPARKQFIWTMNQSDTFTIEDIAHILRTRKAQVKSAVERFLEWGLIEPKGKQVYMVTLQGKEYANRLMRH